MMMTILMNIMMCRRRYYLSSRSGELLRLYYFSFLKHVASLLY